MSRRDIIGRTRVFMLCLMLCAGAFVYAADHVKIGDLYYNIDESAQTAEVTYDKQWSSENYKGLTAVVIESTVTYENVSYPVTSIKTMAFYLSSISSVTIGSNVAKMGSMAFYGCKSLSAITCNAVTPPSIDGSVFSGGVSVSTIAPVVPSQSIDAYKAASGWSEFQWPQAYTITVVSSDESKGTVSGGGTYGVGSQQQISATPNEVDCYSFVQWEEDGNTDNPRTITVSGNATYTAQFAKTKYTIEVKVDESCTGQGKVSAVEK